MAFRRLHELRSKRAIVIVEYTLRPERCSKFAAVLRSGRCENLCPDKPSDLYGEGAYTAASPLYENALASAQLTTDKQRMIRRHAGSPKACPLSKRKLGRQDLHS